MKNGELPVALAALRTLSEKKMPVKTGLKIRTMLRSLSHLAEDVEAERKKLIDALSVKGEDGQPVVVQLDNGLGRYDFGNNLGEFERCYNELMNLDASGRPSPLTVAELGEIEIEATVLIGLGDLLEDE